MLNSAKIIYYLIGDFIHGSSGNPGQLPASEVLVEDVVGDFLQVLQVGSDEHVAQWHEVAVLHVFDLEMSHSSAKDLIGTVKSLSLALC